MSRAESELADAIKAVLAKDRLSLGVHCTLAELESYHQETLSAEEHEAVADHVAACEDCAILLRYALAAAGDTGSQREPGTLEIEEAWDRLRPCLESRRPSGSSLARLLREQRMLPKDALPLALKISQALAFLHASGRKHADLRAENVLVTDAGEVRLLDRGFAPTPEIMEPGSRRSATAMVVDLHRSLSPEQLLGEEPDQRSNLFSLGVLLYELLTGVSPFRARTPSETARAILALDPVPAGDLNPDLRDDVSDLLQRLLAKEPENRPADAAAVVRALEAVRSPREVGGDRLQEGPAGREDEIGRLYDEVLVLAHEQAADGRRRDQEIERSYARLRELQAAEAQEFRARYEASLAMPIDAGRSILARVRALKEELEGLTAADPDARKPDDA